MENKNNQKGALAYQVLGWIFLAMFFLSVVSVIYYRQTVSLKVDTTLINHKTNSQGAVSNVVDYQSCLQAGYAAEFNSPETCNLPDGRVFLNPNRTPASVNDIKLGERCPDIVTNAKDPDSGEIKIFPTVCNIPVDWILIK